MSDEISTTEPAELNGSEPEAAGAEGWTPNERELRAHCLNLAHNPAFEVTKVVERAAAYYEFLMEVDRAEETETEAEA